MAAGHEDPEQDDDRQPHHDRDEERDQQGLPHARTVALRLASRSDLAGAAVLR